MDQDVRKLQGLLYLYADKSRPYRRHRAIFEKILFMAFLLSIIAGTYGSTSNNKIIHYIGIVVLISTIIIAIILLANTIVQKHNLAKLRESCIDLYIERFIIKTLEQYFDNVSYDHRKSFTKKLIKATQIFSNAPPDIKYQFSGILKATYRGIPFSLSHIEVARQQYGEDEKVIMSGYWIVLSYSKKIDSEICVLRKNTGFVGSRRIFETESNNRRR